MKDVLAARAEALNAAMRDGLREAGEMFAARLNETAAVTQMSENAVQVVLEGAGLRTREFGTRTIPARPVAGAALQAARRDIVQVLTRRMMEVFR